MHASGNLEESSGWHVKMVEMAKALSAVFVGSSGYRRGWCKGSEEASSFAVTFSLIIFMS